MSRALNQTGRQIVYAMCNWGNDDPYDWAYTIANSGRMSGDIYDSFNRPDDRCPCTEAPGCAWPGFHCKHQVLGSFTTRPLTTFPHRLRHEYLKQDASNH